MVTHCRKQRAVTGVWIEEYEMAHIPQKLASGPWFTTIGVGGPTGYWLLPEETLLMVSSGRMELLDEDGLEMGVLGAWGACIEPTGGVNTYLVRTAGFLPDFRFTHSCDGLGIMSFDLGI
jgi:tRNA-splicing endonuclease subunit sen54 N-term